MGIFVDAEKYSIHVHLYMEFINIHISLPPELYFMLKKRVQRASRAEKSLQRATSS